MQQVIGMLGGESWESILARQQQQEERARNFGLAVAAGLLLAFFITK
jgi:hypothetical protein